MRIIDFLKRLRRRKVSERKAPGIPNLELGVSLEEAEAWVQEVRECNAGMETYHVRVGIRAQAERQAELAYRRFKREFNKLPGDAQAWFWLKVLWFAAWKAPYQATEEIGSETAKVDLGDGWKIAHTPRPHWIRRPRGGDAFDRGETAERLDVPV